MLMQRITSVLLYLVVMIQVISLFNLYGVAKRHALATRSRHLSSLTSPKAEPGKMPYYDSDTDEDYDDHNWDSTEYTTGYESEESVEVEDSFEYYDDYDLYSYTDFATNFKVKVIDVGATQDEIENLDSPVIIFEDSEARNSDIENLEVEEIKENISTAPEFFSQLHSKSIENVNPLVAKTLMEPTTQLSGLVEKEVKSQMVGNLNVDDAPLPLVDEGKQEMDSKREEVATILRLLV